MLARIANPRQRATPNPLKEAHDMLAPADTEEFR